MPRWMKSMVLISRKRADPPPKVTPEALAELERSRLRCDLCRTKFLSQETWEEHMRDYHKPVKLTKVKGLKEDRYEP